MIDSVLCSGAVHQSKRRGSYPHILAYLKTAQDVKAKTYMAVHVAVTLIADLGKSELFSRISDEEIPLLRESDLGESDIESEADGVDEEDGDAGMVSSGHDVIDDEYC